MYVLVRMRNEEAAGTEMGELGTNRSCMENPCGPIIRMNYRSLRQAEIDQDNREELWKNNFYFGVIK